MEFLPVPDPELPRAQRLYPFRAAGPHELAECNRDIGDALLSVLPMIKDLIRRYGVDHMAEWEADDLFSDILAHLGTRSLPRYRSDRHSKVSTFAFACVRNYIHTWNRLRIHRWNASKRKRDFRVLLSMIESVIACPDTRHDRAIEALADDVFAHPERYFSGTQAAAFRAVEGSVGEPKELRQVAKELGYRQPSSLSVIRSRLKQRVAELAREHIG